MSSDDKDFNMSPELSNLYQNLVALHKFLRDDTYKNFKRINPFIEDLTDWKERGEFLFGPNKNITVYQTSTILGDVKVGENTWVGPYTSLDGQGGLKIGKNCSISSGVVIVTHDSIKWALSNGKISYELSPVSIGDNCFIGTNAIITKGVDIGHHSVVAAGAVVVKSCPPYSIVGGVPGRIIGNVFIHQDGNIELKYLSK
jgi:acetyltransferase-like isoleucine patch superfamily enzyme